MYEKTISSKIIHRGKFLDFKEDIIEIENTGETVHGVRQYMVHPGGVCIIPVLEDGKIVLEKQFRKPLEKSILEIPAGKIDPGEHDKLETAKRELQEETGYTAGSWTYLGEIYPCPGYSTEVLYIYLAEDLVPGDQCLDYGEFIELEYLSLKEIEEKIAIGESPDSKTISAIFLYKLRTCKAY